MTRSCWIQNVGQLRVKAKCQVIKVHVCKAKRLNMFVNLVHATVCFCCPLVARKSAPTNLSECYKKPLSCGV